VDILILGAGWTAQFLIPLLEADPRISFAATTRDGKTVAGHNTIKFVVDEHSDWSRLPKARTVILTFPTTKQGAVTDFVHTYEKSHGAGWTRWLQLGSTGAYDAAFTNDEHANKWITRYTPIPRPAAPRVESEFELLDLSSSSSPAHQTAVLNLSGLWGGGRIIRNWVSRIAPSKEALAKKGSVHFIHGLDVARAIVALHFDFPVGERWILTDGRVYDWWDLASAWGSGGDTGRNKPIQGEQPRWVLELMKENHIFALPRPPTILPGRHLSSAEFWTRFGLTPWHARLEGPS